MENIINLTHKHFIQNINSSNQDNKDFLFERNHIFFDILDKLSEVIKDGNEVISIYFTFNCYQKALDYSRLKQHSIAEYWINYINSKTFNLTELSKKSMQALYFPMISYYEYNLENYDLSIRYLEKSFDLLLKLEKNDGINEVFWARMEQYLNLSRIYFSKKDTNKGIDIGCELINYFLTKKIDSKLIEGNDKILNHEKHNELYLTINYNIDSILRRIYFYKYNSEKKDLLIKFLTKINVDNNDFNELNQAISLLIKILKNRNINRISSIDVFFTKNINLRKVPSLLLYIILEEFFNTVNSVNYKNKKQLRLDINDYYESVGISYNKNIKNSSIIEKEIRGLI